MHSSPNDKLYVKNKVRKTVASWYKFIKNPPYSKEFQQRMDYWGLEASRSVGRLLQNSIGITVIYTLQIISLALCYMYFAQIRPP